MKITTTITMAFLVCVSAHSQTYNHDASVMNQFTVGETGAGHLTPDFWYDAFHKDYRNSAMTTNKLGFRNEMQLLALSKEEGHAEAIDSALTERMRVELLNIADRMPGVGDLAWYAEKSKIEGKLAILKGNIEKITLSGGTPDQYRQWLERYNAVFCGLQAVRDAYMPQGNRKEQYLAIYKDILLKNMEVCELLSYLRAAREAKKSGRRAKFVPRSDHARIARSAHGRWKIAMAAGSGFSGNYSEESADDRLDRLRDSIQNKRDSIRNIRLRR